MVCQQTVNHLTTNSSCNNHCCIAYG